MAAVQRVGQQEYENLKEATAVIWIKQNKTLKVTNGSGDIKKILKRNKAEDMVTRCPLEKLSRCFTF